MRIERVTATLVMVALLAACNITTPDMTPTPEILISDTPTAVVSPSSTPSATPSATATQDQSVVPVVIASPLPTLDTVPTADAPPQPTTGPCEVTIQDGQSLTQALLANPCGNEVNQGLIAAVVAFNDNISNPDFVSPGLTFFVPLPTPTPIPVGADLTETAAARDGVTLLGNTRFVQGQEFGCYEIQEGDSPISIADNYNTSLEVLSQLNRNLNWSGCDFTNPSGGPNCAPNLRVGACMQVPLPTATPVPTNTPSGRETATPTPTYQPALTFYPPQGAIVSQRITVEWVTIGVLEAGEVYLLEVEDRTAGTLETYVTARTRYTLPDSAIPADGQPHQMAWRVRVARQNADGTYTPVGGIGTWRTFQWNSR